MADCTSMDFVTMSYKASVAALVLNVACDGGRIRFCQTYNLFRYRL